MTAIVDRLLALANARWLENLARLLTRLALAGVFWRSGRTKVEEGSFMTLSDTTVYLFEEEYAGVPLPPELAACMATYAEHLFPLLLVPGLATRLSALALIGMTLVIQIFVYPEAWWPEAWWPEAWWPEAWWSVHALWIAMAMQLVTRGGGDLSIDRLIRKPAA